MLRLGRNKGQSFFYTSREGLQLKYGSLHHPNNLGLLWFKPLLQKNAKLLLNIGSRHCTQFLFISGGMFADQLWMQPAHLHIQRIALVAFSLLQAHVPHSGDTTRDCPAMMQRLIVRTEASSCRIPASFSFHPRELSEQVVLKGRGKWYVKNVPVPSPWSARQSSINANVIVFSSEVPPIHKWFGLVGWTSLLSYRFIFSLVYSLNS